MAVGGVTYNESKYAEAFKCEKVTDLKCLPHKMIPLKARLLRRSSISTGAKKSWWFCTLRNLLHTSPIYVGQKTTFQRSSMQDDILWLGLSLSLQSPGVINYWVEHRSSDNDVNGRPMVGSEQRPRATQVVACRSSTNEKTECISRTNKASILIKICKKGRVFSKMYRRFTILDFQKQAAYNQWRREDERHEEMFFEN